jgi:hypothetical protein
VKGAWRLYSNPGSGISQSLTFQQRPPRYAPEGAPTYALTRAEARRYNRDERLRSEIFSKLGPLTRTEGWIYVVRPSGTVADVIAPW